MDSSKRGQSLVELLVAIGIGAILFVGSAVLIAPSLQINKATSQVQAATGLGNELLDNVRVFSEGNWNSLLSLATSSAHAYYLITSSSPFTATSGVESIQVSTTTFTRFFYLSDVYRDSNGNVTSTASGNTYDPSTKQVSVVYNWTRGVTTTIAAYLTRNRTAVFSQTNWSGGPGFSGPTTSTNSEFYVATNMNYSSPDSLTVTPPATNGWPNGYLYRRTITASSSLVAPSGTSLSNFPMLISGTYSYLAASSSVSASGTLQNPNGYDIIFTSDASGTMPLAYERESYSSSTGAIIDWVNVPTLSSSSNVIYMFYDNPLTATDQSNATGTWNSNYVFVDHMADNVASTTILDSTANANYSISQAHDTNIMTTSTEIGKGFKVDGSTDSWVTSNNVAISSSTYSIWVRSDAAQGAYVRLMETNYNNDGLLGVAGNGTSFYFIVNGGSGICAGDNYGCALGGSAVQSSTFHYLTGTYDGSTARLYVDGSLVASDTVSPPAIDSQPLYTGQYVGGGYHWNGALDEERLSNIARSADWIATEYKNQSNPATFYTVGAAVMNGGGSGGVISSSTNQHWAWNDSIGWIDFYNSNNVSVSSTGLHGYASSSVGDISLDSATTRNGNISASSTYQVLNDGSGNLSGWAWNDTIGWISFCGGQSSANCPGTTNYETTIDSSGNFQGWAWNDSIGWIDFNCDNSVNGGGICGTSNFEVKTTWLPPSSSTSTIGSLDSPTFDTGVASGAQFNSILWQGTQYSGSSVQFQLAVSNSSSGPWNYIGYDGTSNTYYTPSGPGDSVSLNDGAFNDYRYFRYRIFITATASSSAVNDIVVNWSP